MTTTPTPIDPESLVARMMEELRANPAAQQLLMQALLTREFLGMPLRLERIEAQLDAMLGRMDRLEEGQRRLEGQVGRLEEGQRRLEGQVGRLEEQVGNLEEGQRSHNRRLGSLEDKVGALIGDNLELKLPGRIIPLLSQKIRLRRAELMRSPIFGLKREVSEAAEDAVDAGSLEDWQETRIGLTDIIMRAQRQSDRAWVWIAVEASSSVRQHDIERARLSADSLSALFGQDAIAVVAGYQIGDDEMRQASEAGVETLIIE